MKVTLEAKNKMTMTKNEKIALTVILFLITLFISIDVFDDMKEGSSLFHLSFEIFLSLLSLLGFFIVLKNSLFLQKKLENEKIRSEKLSTEKNEWKLRSQKYIEGLSQSIDDELTKWKLTNAEKEVALLLLKGLSLKEIAEIRNTSEKTARIQSMSIYSKSELKGRSELQAYFLEDLLVTRD